MLQVTTATAIPRLKTAGWSLEVMDDCLHLTSRRVVRVIIYTDSIGSLVSKIDVERAVLEGARVCQPL